MKRKTPGPAESKVAILLVGHGSRAADAGRVLQAVATSIRNRYRRCLVEIAYFELNAPDIPTGIDRCAGQGATRVLLVPFAPYLDGHVGRDLPEHLSNARLRHPTIDIRIAAHLGPDPRLVAICADRVKQGLRAGRWA
jgi:sirohydrochlorin ferrochelatase